MKKQKRLLCLLLIFIFTCSLAVQNVFSAGTGITVVVNGKAVSSEGVLIDAVPFVPVKDVFEALGFDVDYYPDEKMVVINNMYCMLTMIMGNTHVYVNDEGYVTAEALPQIYNSKSMCPLNIFREIFGISTIWLSNTSTVYINSAGQSLNALSENILPFDSSSGGSSSSGSSSGSTASSGSSSGSTAVNTGGGLIASALDSESSSYNVTSSSVYIQDPYYYFDETLGMSSKSVNDNEEIFTFNSSGGTDDYEAAEKYVNLIASKCNLKVTTDYYDQKTSLFFSWGLTYTGSGRITQKGSVNYTNDEGNVTMWGLVKRSSFKFVIAIPTEFDIVDLGYRYSGNNVSAGLYGQSAAAGLYKNSDGSFSTSDGRLTTSLGNATVLRDGTKYTGEVRVDAASKDYRTDYWVEDYYRDEVLIFGAPTGRLMTGDIYTLDDLTIDTSSGSFSKAKDLTGWTWTTFLGIGHSDKFFVPTYKTDYVKNLTLRVMYYEKDVAMVYYICAEFNSEPYVVEALCAADLSNVKEYTGAAGEYDLSVGQTVDITCPTVSMFSTTFELFTWEATSGSNLVSLSGTVGQTCTVKALSPGTARVKVTYEFSEYYNDPLTGNVRVDPNASKTYEYIINIS